jgi:hypothetical protein
VRDASENPFACLLQKIEAGSPARQPAGHALKALKIHNYQHRVKHFFYNIHLSLTLTFCDFA